MADCSPRGSSQGESAWPRPRLAYPRRRWAAGSGRRAPRRARQSLDSAAHPSHRPALPARCLDDGDVPACVDAPSGDSAAVTFENAPTYERALDDVTSLGLRLSNPCVELMIRYGVNYFSLSDPNVASGKPISLQFSCSLRRRRSRRRLGRRLAGLPGSPQVTQPIIANCPKIPVNPDPAGEMQDAPPLATRQAAPRLIRTLQRRPAYGRRARIAAGGPML